MSKLFVPMSIRFLAVCLSVLVLGCGQEPNSGDLGSAAKGDAASEKKLIAPTEPVASRSGSLAKIRRMIADRDFDAAKVSIQTHLIRHPDDIEALLLTAQVDAGLGQYDQAIDRLTEIAQANPDLDDARGRLADLLNQRGFRFDANEQVRALCERGKATADQLRGLITPSRAFTGFREKPDIHNQALMQKYGTMNVARGLFSEGDVTEAAAALKQSDLIRDGNSAAVAFYGQVLLEAQQFDEFERWLEAVDERCERYPAYWLALGSGALRDKNHRAAIRMFAEAILREPGDLVAVDRMTEALAAAGRDEESERFRQRGIDIDQIIQHTADLMQRPDGALQSISQISQLLRQVGRPAESLEWVRIGLERMGSPADAMRQHREAMSELARAETRAEARQAILCGLNLDEFPLDDAVVSSVHPHIDSTLMSSFQNRQPSRQPVFVNVAEVTDLNFRYRNAVVPVEREMLIFQQIGGGVACFDYDLDGRVDFYFGQASGDPPNRLGTQPNLLSRCLGNRFVDITELADCDDRNYTCGVTAGDWNQDGFVDLVVANLQRNTLFINQGDGTFRRHAGDDVWNHDAYTSSLAIADLNGDQLPDIVEVNYLDDSHIFDPIEHRPDGTPIRLPAPLYFRHAVDRVFISAGDGSLSGQILGDTERPLPSTGLGVVVTDVDGEIGNEIFVANDHMANHFWEARRDSGSGAAWQNTAAIRGLAYGASGAPLGSMGIAAADFDENGRIDFHVTNFENQWSNLFVQNDDAFFDDLVVAFGLAEPTYEMLGFGTQAIDYDNNSIVELVIGNGHVEDLTASGKSQFEMPTQLFGLSQSKFQQLDVIGDDSYWRTGHLTRALAYCDWNRDGRVDFVTTDLKQPVALLENRTDTPYHWLQLQLVGTRCERDAIGAIITATYGPCSISKHVQSGDGYMCKNESIICFGLGDQNSIDHLVIRWPNGNVQTLSNLSADRRWLIVEDEQEPFEITP